MERDLAYFEEQVMEEMSWGHNPTSSSFLSDKRKGNNADVIQKKIAKQQEFVDQCRDAVKQAEENNDRNARGVWQIKLKRALEQLTILKRQAPQTVMASADYSIDFNDESDGDWSWILERKI